MSDRFINNSPRVQIRDRDNKGEKSSKIKRTGDQRTGTGTSVYDDTKSIVFQQENDIIFSQMIKSGSEYTVVSSSYAGYLSGTGNVVKGISDEYVIDNQTQSAALSPFDETRLVSRGTSFTAAMLYNGSPSGSVENQNVNPPVSNPSFFLTGTSIQILPGFSDKLLSKTSFEIDLSAQNEQIFVKHPKDYMSTHTTDYANSQFFGKDYSGMAYFNFDNGTWDQIGITDYATGNPYDFSWTITGSLGNTEPTNGTEKFVQQFVSETSSSLNSLTTLAEVKNNSNLSKLGSPTCVAFAPFATKYHATASSAYDMSRSIKQPFLLEKVQVTLPITARIAPITQNGYPMERGQHIWNWTFFAYRQERKNHNDVVDSLQDISSSDRFIVFSGSICFYKLGGTGLNALTEDFEPQHSPSFKYGFDISRFNYGSAVAEGIFTGSIVLDLEPAVANKLMLGSSGIDWREGPPDSASEYPSYFNYWPGGTTTRAFGDISLTGRIPEVSASIVSKAPVPTSDTNFRYFINEIDPTSYSKTTDQLPIEKYDPRTLSPFGAGNADNDGLVIIGDADESVSVLDPQSKVSPYLLLPTDELVFGIDTQTSIVNGTGGGTNVGFHTASYMTVVPGKASVKMFGSLLREGKQYHNTLNQELTTDTVHEFIGEEIVDEYIIAPREMYSGSNGDDVMLGSIFGELDLENTQPDELQEVSRVRYLSANSQPKNIVLNGNPFQTDLIFANNEVSASRNDLFFGDLGRGRSFRTTIASTDERFYDSMLPSLKKYGASSNETVFTPTGSFIFDPHPSPDPILRGTPDGFAFRGDAVTGTLGSLGVKKAEHPFLSDRALNPYPYSDNPARFKNEEMQLVISSSVNDYYREVVINSVYMLRTLLFGRGYRLSVEGADLYDPRKLHHSVSGSTGYKYGIMSVFPQYPTTIFRPGRYGQFRDTLEQRKDSRVFKQSKGKDDVSTVQGLLQAPVTVKFVQNGELIDGGGLDVLSGSSNRSNAATSSLPYVDNVFNNWTSVI